MATKCFCDRCGKDGAARMTFSGAVSEGRLSLYLGKSFDADLCSDCAKRAAELVQRAYTEALSKE